MDAREGRPLLLIDLAVPRDIHPDCREVDGVSLHDMDDLQTLVERNASRPRGRGPPSRDRRCTPSWAASSAGSPRRRSCPPWLRCASEPTRSSIACWPRTSRRWEALSQADRERMQAMARAIASRLLHEPTLRLKRSSGEDDGYVYVNALRELFGLDARSAPLEARDAQVHPLRAARRRKRPAECEQPAEAGNAGKPARARAGAARRRRAGRGRDRHRQLERRRARRQGALRARGRTGGAERRGGPGGPLGQGPARRPPRRAQAGGRARPRRSRRCLRGRGVVARRGAPGGTRRNRKPAPALPAFGVAAGSRRGGAAWQRRHPAAQAVRRRVRRDRGRRRGPSPSRARGRDRLRLRGRGADAGRRAGIAGAGGAPRRRRRRRRSGIDQRPRRPG